MFKKGIAKMPSFLSLEKEIIFSRFRKEIRAFPEDHTGMGHAEEIRGSLHGHLSHSNVGPKMMFKGRKRENKKQILTQWWFSFFYISIV